MNLFVMHVLSLHHACLKHPKTLFPSGWEIRYNINTIQQIKLYVYELVGPKLLKSSDSYSEGALLEPQPGRSLPSVAFVVVLIR